MAARHAQAAGQIWGRSMSHLTLVRHGQASFFADDYDRLSELGEQQARLLGDYWVRQGIQFDEVYAGPRVRQQKSAELVGDAYRRAGLPFPEMTVLNELDEYDLIGLSGQVVPQLASIDPKFAKLIKDYQEAGDESGRLRTFQRMFEILLKHWQLNELKDLEVEGWSKFQRRVRGFLTELQSRTGRSRRIAAFSSGGFIGTAAQVALGAPDSTALELNWRVRNSSLTEFVFTETRLTLDSFNSVSHLDDQSHWTYR